MRVLVAYGSKMGGTEGLARSVGEGLAAGGHQVAVRPASEVEGLDGWDAVVVGGALYGSWWYRQARSFVKRHLEELTVRPVWFFSSGPLDDSASKRDIPPTGSVRRWMVRVEARGHATFGGRLDPATAKGVARVMAKQTGGDWRDMGAARAWGTRVADELTALGPRRVPVVAARPRTRERVHHALAALCLFTAVTALWGGLALFGWPRTGGLGIHIPLSALEPTPFRTFLVPGLLLFFLVGVPNLVAWVMVLKRHRFSEIAAFGAGAALAIFMLSEMVLLRSAIFLQWLYLAVGVATLAAALWLWTKRHAFVHPGRRLLAA